MPKKNKKVILSFDDGYHEDYSVAYKYLKEKGLVATSFVVVNDVGRNGYLSWDEIREMIKNGWDFQCHTNHHLMLDKVSKEEIERDIAISKNEFFRRLLPIPEVFAYPFGVKNESIINIIKQHFKMARGGATSNGDDYDIVSYGIHGKHDIEKLIKENKILFLHTHDVSNKHRGFGVSVAKFKKTIDLLIKNGFEFITMNDYLNNKENYKKEAKEDTDDKVDNKKAVIMAAGSGSRWGDYMGVTKQTLKVEGEPIIHRTIRLLRENGIDEIYVTVPEKGYFGKLDAVEIKGSSENEINKFINAKEHSGAIFLWGDCFFSEEAIKTIIENKEPLMFFGRSGGSKFTKKVWGEIFAVKTNDLFFEKVMELEKHKNEMNRCASWELYGYILEGKIPYTNYRPHKNGFDENGLCVTDPERVRKYFTEIDDFTDDFDYPKDYDNWISLYENNNLKSLWTSYVPKKISVSYNVMAHPSRSEFIPYLKNKLGNVKIIWDKNNNGWDTRKMCLKDHIKQGKDFGVTIQDDAILCEGFKDKVETFINQIGDKEAIYNFFYRMYSDVNKIDEAIKNNSNYIINDIQGITSELCFAFPTKLMKEMMDVCNNSNGWTKHMPGITREGDWIMDERYVKKSKMKTYFSVPSLADHRAELESLFYPDDYLAPVIRVCRRAWWFYGEPWEGQAKKDRILIKNGIVKGSKTLEANLKKEILAKKEKEKVEEGMVYITNLLPTLNSAYGTDLLFEPRETKAVKKEIAENIIKHQETFKMNTE